MKKIILVVMLIVLAACMAGCNYTMFDTTWTFDRAIFTLPDGTISDGKVQTWKDFEDGDQIQVRVNDVTYLVHSSDIVLMAE